MLTCDEVQRELSDHLDGRGGVLRRAMLRMHLMVCRTCGPLARSLEVTVGLLHQLRDAPLPEPEGEVKAA